jgi:hypothetical protein
MILRTPHQFCLHPNSKYHLVTKLTMLYIELEHGDRIFVISTLELVRNSQEKYLRNYLPEYPGETAG